MNKKKKKTKTTEPKPGDFKTQAEAEEAVEEYIKSQPIYTVFNFFFGGPNNVNKIKSNVEGKPNPPY
jgi:hypothetical protein